MFRVALAAACAVLAFEPGPALADPFTSDHLLHLERIGQVALSPDEAFVAFEHIGPMLTGGPFEHDAFGIVRRSKIYLASMAGEGASRIREVEDGGRGVVIGAWSPNGRSLLVYGLGGGAFSAGVADARTGAVRWIDGTPETALWGRAAQWRSSDELLLLLRPQNDLPTLMDALRQTQARQAELWDLTRAGAAPGRTTIGGGAFLRINPRPAEGTLVRVGVNGEPDVLARGRFHDLEISPGGRFAAAVRFTDDRPFAQDRPFLQGDFTERRELTLVDLETGQAWEPLPGKDVIPNLLAWSPDGGRLLVWVRSDGAPWSSGQLVQVDARRRSTTTTDLRGYSPAIIQTALRTEVVCADWLADEPLLYVRNGDRNDWVLLTSSGARVLTGALPSPSFRLAANSGDQLVVQSQGEAWRVDRHGSAVSLGRPVRPEITVTSGLFSLGQRFQFNSPPARDWIMVGDEDRRSRVDLNTGLAFGGNAPPETLAAVGAARALGRRIDADFAEILSADDGAVLMRVNADLSEIEFSEPAPASHLGPNGEQLISWLDSPSASLDGRKPPLIVLPYPGSPARAQAPTEESVMTNIQIMTSAGYAVLVPSLPRAAAVEPGAGMANDILAAVDAAVPLGVFDPDRVVLWGHSFGAWAAVTAATQSDRFAAVIAANGPYDLLSVWGQFPLTPSLLPESGLPVRSRAGWVETGQAGLHVPPFVDPALYLRNSPAFSSSRITAPVLLFTGDRDYVPSGQAEELFSALYRQQKDVVLVTYRGEGHVLSSPANIRDMYATVWLWLREVLSDPTRLPRRIASD